MKNLILVIVVIILPASAISHLEVPMELQLGQSYRVSLNYKDDFRVPTPIKNVTYLGLPPWAQADGSSIIVNTTFNDSMPYTIHVLYGDGKGSFDCAILEFVLFNIVSENKTLTVPSASTVRSNISLSLLYPRYFQRGFDFSKEENFNSSAQLTVERAERPKTKEAEKLEDCDNATFLKYLNDMEDLAVCNFYSASLAWLQDTLTQVNS